MVTVIALYLLLNYAYYAILGTDGIAQSKLVAATLSRATFGPAGELVISVAVFLSAAGFLNAMILQMPRSLHAMASDGVLPSAFMRVNPRTQAHEVGLLFCRGHDVAARLRAGLVRDAPQLRDLHRHAQHRDGGLDHVRAAPAHMGDGGFAVPGYPLVPALFLAWLLCVATSILVTQPRLALAGIIVLLTGWPLFRLGRRLSSPPAS